MPYIAASPQHVTYSPQPSLTCASGRCGKCSVLPGRPAAHSAVAPASYTFSMPYIYRHYPQPRSPPCNCNPNVRQDRLEAQPVLFQEEEALVAMRQAQLAVAGFVGAEPRDLVFVANATTAVNVVLQSTQASSLQQRRTAGSCLHRSCLVCKSSAAILATTCPDARCSSACNVIAHPGCPLLFASDCPFPLPTNRRALSLPDAAVPWRSHSASLDHLPRCALRRRPRGGAARRSASGGGAPECTGGAHRGRPAAF